MIWVKSHINDAELVYIHVPRTGGVSVMDALKNHQQLHTVAICDPHMTAAQLLNIYPQSEERAEWTAAIREPFSWLVSQWAVVEREEHKHPYKGMWPEFVDYVCNHWVSYGWWTFQSDFIAGGPDKMTLFPFDVLERQWRFIEDVLDVDIPREHRNHARRPYEVYYDDSLRAYVRKAYKSDFVAYKQAKEQYECRIQKS